MDFLLESIPRKLNGRKQNRILGNGLLCIAGSDNIITEAFIMTCVIIHSCSNISNPFSRDLSQSCIVLLTNIVVLAGTCLIWSGVKSVVHATPVSG